MKNFEDKCTVILTTGLSRRLNESTVFYTFNNTNNYRANRTVVILLDDIVLNPELVTNKLYNEMCAAFSEASGQLKYIYSRLIVEDVMDIHEHFLNEQTNKMEEK